jgi:hypothetical protein
MPAARGRASPRRGSEAAREGEPRCEPASGNASDASSSCPTGCRRVPEVGPLYSVPDAKEPDFRRSSNSLRTGRGVCSPSPGFRPRRTPRRRSFATKWHQVAAFPRWPAPLAPIRGPARRRRDRVGAHNTPPSRQALVPLGPTTRRSVRCRRGQRYSVSRVARDRRKEGLPISIKARDSRDANRPRTFFLGVDRIVGPLRVLRPGSDSLRRALVLQGRPVDPPRTTSSRRSPNRAAR